MSVRVRVERGLRRGELQLLQQAQHGSERLALGPEAREKLREALAQLGGQLQGALVLGRRALLALPLPLPRGDRLRAPRHGGLG